MIIKKSYDRNINLGNYQTARIGITLEKEITGKVNSKKLKEVSNKLLSVSKKIVNEELEALKTEERMKNNE
jgi:hypothetical protein